MTIKRIAALFIAVFLVFSTAGCSKGNQADTDAVSAAMDKFRACTSFTVVHILDSTAVQTLGEESHTYSGSNVMEISIITGSAPRMKSTTTMLLEYDGEQGEQVTTSYLVTENGVYTEYFTDGSQWYMVSTEDESVLPDVSADTVEKTFSLGDISFRKAGEESIGGEAALRYEGVIKGEPLVSMLEINGRLSSISSMSENQQAKIRENLVKDLKGVTVSVWIAEESGYPVRFEANLTETLSEIDKSISKTLGGKSTDDQVLITEDVITISVADFNAVSEIALPPEAASAQPYEFAEASAEEDAS